MPRAVQQVLLQLADLLPPLGPFAGERAQQQQRGDGQGDQHGADPGDGDDAHLLPRHVHLGGGAGGGEAGEGGRLLHRDGELGRLRRRALRMAQDEDLGALHRLSDAEGPVRIDHVGGEGEAAVPPVRPLQHAAPVADQRGDAAQLLPRAGGIALRHLRHARGGGGEGEEVLELLRHMGQRQGMVGQPMGENVEARHQQPTADGDGRHETQGPGPAVASRDQAVPPPEPGRGPGVPGPSNGLRGLRKV